MDNRYTMLEYIERVSNIGKHEKQYADTKRKSKELRDREIDILAECKSDQKAYERFKRKSYTVGGVTIEQKKCKE